MDIREKAQGLLLLAPLLFNFSHILECDQSLSHQINNFVKIYFY
jgi:hypothetical protein